MANNRMFLVHRPTMLGVMLAKRYSSWYTKDSPTVHSKLNALFDLLDEQGNSTFDDDFCLVMEDADRAPMATDTIDFHDHLEGGVIQFKENKPCQS